MKAVRIRVFLLIVLAGALSACVGPRDTGGCALVAHYQGRVYHGLSVQVAPVEGRPLGRAVVSRCADAGGTAPADEHIPVAALPGVSPEVALVWRGVSDAVLVRDGVGELPAEVDALLRAPRCDPSDVPIDLSGPWLGIHDADRTEVDLVPPYDVDLLVERASATRYVRAFLTIHVPQSLGRPISQEDIDSALRREGTISVTASCLDGGYLAQRVKVSSG